MTKTCDYCEKKVAARGMCHRHYRLWQQDRPMDTPSRRYSPLPAKHPFYQAWVNMKTRCNNPNSTQWKWYGARGICYDPEWEDFYNFFEAMWPGWVEGFMLDRKDNDKGYSALNCRWVPAGLSAINRRPRGTC